jgi:hypothetical protein
MPLDLSQFAQSSVTDSCAVWNILSSSILNGAAREAGRTFCCTAFVEYECLKKPRQNPTSEEKELIKRLNSERGANRFQTYQLTIDDLLDFEVLERRKRLGKGELSTIVFAKRTALAIVTDDQKARRLAGAELSASSVQTTPQLLGWLIFTQRLGDGDVDRVVDEHQRMKRPLSKFFREAYELALQYRLNASRE